MSNVTREMSAFLDEVYEYVEEKRKLRAAIDACEPGYGGPHYTAYEAVERAEQRVETAFDALMKARAAAA